MKKKLLFFGLIILVLCTICAYLFLVNNRNNEVYGNINSTSDVISIIKGEKEEQIVTIELVNNSDEDKILFLFPYDLETNTNPSYICYTIPNSYDTYQPDTDEKLIFTSFDIPANTSKTETFIFCFNKNYKVSDNAYANFKLKTGDWDDALDTYRKNIKPKLEEVD